MLQLQPLSLARTEEELVPVDKTVRPELVGLVARILVTVFQRLSRTDKDWCRLVEVCQIFGTLIGDEQQVYDLGHLDD
jgi:DNA invertase Pin-like site-specific DNA recombinase